MSDFKPFDILLDHFKTIADKDIEKEVHALMAIRNAHDDMKRALEYAAVMLQRIDFLS